MQRERVAEEGKRRLACSLARLLTVRPVQLFTFQRGSRLTTDPSRDLLDVPVRAQLLPSQQLRHRPRAVLLPQAGATYQTPVYDSSHNFLYYDISTDGNEDKTGTARASAVAALPRKQTAEC